MRFCLKNIFYVVFLFCSISFFPQNFRPSFNLNGGIAFPQGHFKNKDISNEQAGLANPGFFYGFDLGIKFNTTPFGFAISYRKIEAPVDFNAASALTARMLPGVNYSLSTDPWKIRDILGGIYGSFNFDSAGRFNLRPRLLIGMINLTPYQLNIGLPPGSTGSIYNPTRAAKNDFSFLFGLDFRYVFFEPFYVSLSAEYLYSEVDFPVYSTNPKARERYYSQPVDLVNFSIGLGVKW